MSLSSPVSRPFLAAHDRTRSALMLPVFATSLFVSATLLFSVQPMFTKMVLPLLGSSPGVWSVAMVFFQAMLLLGYAYAHLLSRTFSPQRAVLLHLGVLGVAGLCLPIQVVAGWGAPPSEGAALWLIGLFSASIGPPFFAVAANAPVLQAWFARTDHPQARDPYFLYGASNLGSFAALLSYPVLIEPLLTLQQQGRAWTVGFALLIGLLAAVAWLLAAVQPVSRSIDRSAATSSPLTVVSGRERLRWVALALVPSALLVAVTSHISTDLASAPFLWIIPLTLFLLTFVLAFRKGGERMHAWMLRLQPFVVAPLAIGVLAGDKAYWLVAIALDLGMFFIAAMICHRELFLSRPDTSRLTEFYLWISVGGVLGGIASGLLAPVLFPDVWEYPLLLVLALSCRPGFWAALRPSWQRQLALLGLLASAIAAPALLFGLELPPSVELGWKVALVCAAALVMTQRDHPVRVAGLVSLILLATALYKPGSTRAETARSFFGVHKIVDSIDGQFRWLYHGTTIHGAQRLRDASGQPISGPPEPLTYYYFGGPLSEAIAATREQKGSLGRVALVGLGSGSLACHARANERFTFFEIDPQVVRIARDRTKFRFLSDCGGGTDIVLGDARLTLATAEAGFDLIVLDAFSSDAIPVHLLTKEAMDLYLSKLAPGGVLAFHISNRYLELGSVVGEIASAMGLQAWVKQDASVTPESFQRTMHANALVAVVARAEVSPLGQRSGWHRYQSSGAVQPWTDDYSNVLAAIWRKRQGR